MECLKRVVSGELTLLTESFVLCSDIKTDAEFCKLDRLEPASGTTSATLNGLFSRMNAETNIIVTKDPRSKVHARIGLRVNGFHFQCSFCKRWWNTWRLLRSHFSEMHWRFREFSLQTGEFKSCPKCNALEDNTRPWRDGPRLALHFLTEPDHSVEDLLSLGVPLWNFWQPPQAELIRSSQVGQLSSHLFSPLWIEQMEQRVSNWLLQNGYLLDPKKGLDLGVRSKFDVRRLSLKFDEVLKIACEHDTANGDKRGDFKSRKSASLEAGDTKKIKRANIGVSAFWCFAREQKLQSPQTAQGRQSFKFLKENWRKLPASNRKYYYEKAAHDRLQSSEKSLIVSSDGNLRREDPKEPGTVDSSQSREVSQSVMDKNFFEMALARQLTMPTVNQSLLSQQTPQSWAESPALSKAKRLGSYRPSPAAQKKTNRSKNKASHLLDVNRKQTKSIILTKFDEDAFGTQQNIEVSDSRRARRRSKRDKLLKQLQDAANAGGDSGCSSRVSGAFAPFIQDNVLNQPRDLSELEVACSGLDVSDTGCQAVEINATIEPIQGGVTLLRDIPSPISVMSDGQENFYKLLECALEQSQLDRRPSSSKESPEPEKSFQRTAEGVGQAKAIVNPEDVDVAVALNDSMDAEMLSFLKSSLQETHVQTAFREIQQSPVAAIQTKIEPQGREVSNNPPQRYQTNMSSSSQPVEVHSTERQRDLLITGSVEIPNRSPFLPQDPDDDRLGGERNPFQICDCVSELTELKELVRQLTRRVTLLESRSL